MMRVESPRQPAKKKVNGFIGYRAYYSSLFWQLAQKERSPIMTMLWKHDPFHKEWDFMCAVYSDIREALADQNVSLQNWIECSIKHLGIIVRDSYLATLGWELIKLDDGTHKLQRTTTRVIQSHLQPMNGLGLFMNCLTDGLPVANPLPIIARLSDLANDIICINTRPGEPAKSTNTVEGFRGFAKNHPHLAMSALFQVPTTHPLIAQGVGVHQVPDSGISGPGVSTPEPFPNAREFMATQGDAELDAILDNIFLQEGDGDIRNEADMNPHFFTMGMESSTSGF
ncbi:hypothetical protein VTK56DRAFT_8615 [Thermocarpiscus australiensis]